MSSVVQEKEKEDIVDAISRNWEARAKALNDVRTKLRLGWRNDAEVLEQYFYGCYSNWKEYKGPRTPKQVVKLQSLYKQAIHGDIQQVAPINLKSLEGVKWIAWHRLKGMPQVMAKRRFITYLSEIDPLIIDVMPDEKPPDGFPMDRHGRPICAKCNTIVGCDRDLTDEKKIGLRKQLFEDEELHQPANLRVWLQHALEQQRCIWGVHKAVSLSEIKPFMAWFERPSNKGFHSYDSSQIMFMIRDLLAYHYELSYDMQQNKNEYGILQVNEQVSKTLKLKSIYEELSGDEFVFEMVCTRDTEVCNNRRIADGKKNHKHEVILDPPSEADNNSYEESIHLRLQCQKLGLKIATGVVKDIKERCDIYRQRIAEYFDAMTKAVEAKTRNEARTAAHKKEKDKIKLLSHDMISRQCWDACHDNNIEKVITLVRRKCDPNEESPRGLTPLLSCVINNPPVEIIEELLSFKADINKITMVGVSPLMLACRIRETKLVHILLRNGASVIQNAGRKGNNRTALHWCALHGSEEEAKIMMDFIRDNGGDSLRFVRFLDAQDGRGETPLMLAARSRKGLMCKTLLNLGANPNVLNNAGRNAYYIARHAGWSEVADWLEKKVGSGVAKIETYADIQFDQSLRYGAIKIRESIQQFGKLYLKLTHEYLISHLTHHIGNPSKLKLDVKLRGDRALKEHKAFINAHQLFIFNRDIHNNEVTSHATEKADMIIRLKKFVVDFVADIRKGIVDPNCESDAQPFSFTPLMCCVLINDIRSLRLMIREGANPNYPNRYGTTALMLAAQMQSLHAIVEMLIMSGADPISFSDTCDNEGNNILSYANSLPLPSNCVRETISVVLDGDADGAKRMTSYELLKMAETFSPTNNDNESQNLKAILEENIQASNPEVVDNHFKFLRLLEKFGLTRMETTRHISDQTSTSSWRLDGASNSHLQLLADDDQSESESLLSLVSETSIEMRQRAIYEEHMRQLKRQEDENAMLEKGMIRCPLCTLWVPCSHFLKADTVKRFNKAKEEARVNAGRAPGQTGASTGETNDNENDGDTTKEQQENEEKGKKRSSATFFRAKDKRNQILQEAQLSDRNTDRSIAIANAYRPRQIQLLKEQKALHLETSSSNLFESDDSDAAFLIEGAATVRSDKILNALIDDVAASSAAAAAVKTATTPWKKTLDPGDSSQTTLRFENSLTGEAWCQYFDRRSLRYYYSNQVSGESTWDPPNEDIQLLIDTPLESSDNSSNSNERSPSTSVATAVAVAASVPITKSALKKHSTSTELRDPMKPKRRVIISIPGEGEYLLGRDDAPTVATTLPVSVPVVVTTVTVSEQADNVVKSEAVPALPSPTKMSTSKQNLLEALREGDSQSTDSLGANPVPGGSSRRIFLFTSESIDRGGKLEGMFQSTDYLSDIDKKPATKAAARLAVAGKPSSPTNATSGGSSKKFNERKHLVYDPIPNVQISGWLFVSLSSLDGGKAPVDSMSVPLAVWGALLESVRRKFVGDFIPQSDFCPLADPADIRRDKCAIRCTVCAIGYVRIKDRHEVLLSTDKDSLSKLICLPCQIRQEIYDKAKLVLPRTQRRSAKPWPFRRRRPVNEYDHEAEDYIAQKEEELAGLNDTTDAYRVKLNESRMEMLSKSPIVSVKLLRLDDAAALSNEAVIDDADDDKSLGSISNTSYAAAGISEENSISTQSTNPALDVSKHGPRELTLIPFLIAKGHFEEVERLVRLVIGQRGVNEGEGLVLLMRLLSVQAEMYKLMGLWPLAAAIYLDCLEITSRLMGFDDLLTTSFVSKVTLTLRRMDCDTAAKRFISQICDRVTGRGGNGGSGIESNAIMATAIADNDGLQVEAMTKQDSKMNNKLRSITPPGPRSIPRQIFMETGEMGLWTFLRSSGGFIVAARIAFFFFCNLPNHSMKVHQLTLFLQYIVKIQSSDQDEVSRHLVQQLIQKLLSKSLVGKLEIATIFRDVTSAEHMKAINDFLNYGINISLGVFHSMLFYTLQQMTPVFKQFYYGYYGSIIRDSNVEKAARIYFLHASLIQAMWRGVFTRKKLRMDHESIALGKAILYYGNLQCQTVEITIKIV